MLPRPAINAVVIIGFVYADWPGPARNLAVLDKFIALLLFEFLLRTVIAIITHASVLSVWLSVCLFTVC